MGTTSRSKRPAPDSPLSNPTIPDITFMHWNIENFSMKKQAKPGLFHRPGIFPKANILPTTVLNDIAAIIKQSPAPEVVTIVEVVADKSGGVEGKGIKAVSSLQQILSTSGLVFKEAVTDITGKQQKAERYGILVDKTSWAIIKENTKLMKCKLDGAFKRTAAQYTIIEASKAAGKAAGKIAGKIAVKTARKPCNIVSFHAPAPIDMRNFMLQKPNAEGFIGNGKNPLKAVSVAVNALPKDIPLIFAGDFNLQIVESDGYAQQLKNNPFVTDESAQKQESFLLDLCEYIKGLELDKHGQKTSLRKVVKRKNGRLKPLGIEIPASLSSKSSKDEILAFSRKFRSHAYDQIFYKGLLKQDHASVRSFLADYIGILIDLGCEIKKTGNFRPVKILQRARTISDHLPVVAQYNFPGPTTGSSKYTI